ncbi:MAG TPA: PIN domain-containing protein [Thermoanaerobaculia bacterium]|nr:PIN domain-containing protein [Thermoanaerobaculia bacterium]
MIAYVDSSVLLRMVLGQARKLTEWRRIEHGISSVLIEVESLRTLDRFRVAHGMSDREVATRRSAIYRVLDELDLVAITPSVLARASQPMPVSLGTLDAIHIVTALLWREQTEQALVMATHDGDLGRAAAAFGFTVIGVGR